MNDHRPDEPRELLEQKLTALLFGELTAEETAEIRTRIESDPALARLHDELRQTFELLREAVAHPPGSLASTTPTFPTLSRDRRERLLATLKSGPPAPSPAGTEAPRVIPVEFPREGEAAQSPHLAFGIAASLVAALGLMLLWLQPDESVESSPSKLHASSGRTFTLHDRPEVAPPPAPEEYFSGALPQGSTDDSERVVTRFAKEAETPVDSPNSPGSETALNRPASVPTSGPVPAPASASAVPMVESQQGDVRARFFDSKSSFNRDAVAEVGTPLSIETPRLQEALPDGSSVGTEAARPALSDLAELDVLSAGVSGVKLEARTNAGGGGGFGGGGFGRAGGRPVDVATKRKADESPEVASRFGLQGAEVVNEVTQLGKTLAWDFREADQALSRNTPLIAGQPAEVGLGLDLANAATTHIGFVVGLLEGEVATATNAISTFSLNVTDVSFKLADASLANGALPRPETVRSEEFLNAFDYRDPEPGPGAPLAFHWEQARHPFEHDREVLRLAIRTAARGREADRPLNLVLLLDNSGSMDRPDRVAIVRESLRTLAGALRAGDRVSLVAFARTPRLWLDGLPGERSSELVATAGDLVREGGTDLEAALKMAYEISLRHFVPSGGNRVVLMTDGAANLGEVDPEILRGLVELHRSRGVALDAFGIGWEGYNDDLLESLTRHGDGRYGFVNSPEAATTEFADQLAGALHVAASDVKVQVEFNPRRVASWRQSGYTRHQLTREQFRDNTVDAAELGAAESGNALYILDLHERGEGAIGSVRVRYRESNTGIYREQEWAIPFTGTATDWASAAPSLRLATVATAFADWLAGSPHAAGVAPDQLVSFLQDVPEHFAPDPRPARLEAMIREALALSGGQVVAPR